MIGYTPSHLTENEVILEKLNEIIDYLIKNPSYQVYAYNGGFISGTLTYEIANVLNSANINVADVVVFNNGYYGIISEITETEFTLSQGISLIGPQGPQGPQGPKGDTGTIPEALPQEASALKSGELPTSGWTDGDYVTYWTGTVSAYGWEYYEILFQNSSIYSDVVNDIKLVATMGSSTARLYNHGIKQIGAGTTSYPLITGYVFTSNSSYNRDNAKIIVTEDGSVYGTGSYSAGSSNSETWRMVGKYETKSKLYTISDTSITANSDILMELTDEGGVKSYSMEAGKITVIRDTVPTQPIPYTYKVKQTNASGQFTVVNHFVPTVPNTIVESVNGQTGAVTIAVPTKTSELENDSGYVRNVVPPVVQNVVCNDVDSATTLDTTITCEAGDLILAQIIVRSALTLPTDWTLLRTIPAVETSTQTLSFAYKRAASTSETLTVTQATAGRIYTNLVRLSNAVSISYIQSCEKTGTGIKSISSTKPVTPNMVIWGAASATWNTSSPYGDWTYSPSTLDYYSLSQASRQPRLGTFVDSNGAGERTFTTPVDSSTVIMCGAVEIVGDEVARKGDIPTKTSQLTNDSGFITAADIPSDGEWQNWSDTSVLTEEGLYEIVTTEYPSDGNKTLFVQYEQGKPNNGACWVSVATANSISVVTPICSGDGTLRVERRLANSSGPADLLTFKYRKILN